MLPSACFSLHDQWRLCWSSLKPKGKGRGPAPLAGYRGPGAVCFLAGPTTTSLETNSVQYGFPPWLSPSPLQAHVVFSVETRAMYSDGPPQSIPGPCRWVKRMARP